MPVQKPLRVVAFNTAEELSRDVSEDVAHELRRRSDLQLSELPECLRTSSAVTRPTAAPRPLKSSIGTESYHRTLISNATTAVLGKESLMVIMLLGPQ
jgi:hypothetical protein